MPNGYRRVPVEATWMFKEGFAKSPYETNCTFGEYHRDRRYIKILALCLCYAPAKLIYPKTKQPLMHQVRDMCRAGLLERYQRAGDRKYYYKTTPKGQDLLIKALEVK